jgi:5'-nucleotidase
MPCLDIRRLAGAAFAACTLAAGGAHAAAQLPQPQPFDIKIIAFNDYHGNLESPGTFGRNTLVPAANASTGDPGKRPVVGGAEYMAAYVARMKAANPRNVVVGAGDFIGASPLISALFHDEPAVETLNKIGLEFNAVGNHEFDKGKAELLRLQKGGCKFVNGAPDPNSCKGFGSAAPGMFDGAKYKWLSSNVIDNATGRTLLAPYGVKVFNGVRVAFIGMTLKGTPDIVTPTGVAGLTFKDEAETVNALVPRLRALGIEAIVVLVHQGGFQNQLAGVAGQPITSDINGCTGDLRNADGSDSPIRAIVGKLDNAVDLVISGHTHAAYNCSANTVDVRGTNLATEIRNARPTGIPNKVGRLVPVTSSSSFGRLLTEVDVTLNPATRDIVAVSPKNVLVAQNNPEPDPAVVDVAAINDHIAANPELRDVVAAYKAAVSPLANAVVGTIVDAVNNTADAGGMRPAGALIADAQLMATQPAGLGGAVAAFMNPGGVRDQGFIDYVAPVAYPYDVTYGDSFRVQPFGNSLVTMTLTAQQIKNLLEQQFVGCQPAGTPAPQGTQRILQISNGLRYSWRYTQPAPSTSNPNCDFVQELSLTPTDLVSDATLPLATGPTEQIVIGGVVQNPAKTYRVTVNNFLATGGDGFSVLLGGASVLGGAQDIDALVAYFGEFKSRGRAYDRSDANVVGPAPRITQLPR